MESLLGSKHSKDFAKIKPTVSHAIFAFSRNTRGNRLFCFHIYIINLSDLSEQLDKQIHFFLHRRRTCRHQTTSNNSALCETNCGNVVYSVAFVLTFKRETLSLCLCVHMTMIRVSFSRTRCVLRTSYHRLGCRTAGRAEDS